MNVAELFDELWMVSNIEVVVALLPEMFGWPIQARFWLEWEISGRLAHLFTTMTSEAAPPLRLRSGQALCGFRRVG
jgi:hypothetical protein